MAILELRAARGWSFKQSADTFLVTPATIASWVKRIDDQGANALVQLRDPVNKFPDFVRYIVQRLITLNLSMGKVKIAETLCRAGLHLGVTTVGRIFKEAPQSSPGNAAACDRIVIAKRPNHVWHVDLTAVPISAGFWTPWLPFALPVGGEFVISQSYQSVACCCLLRQILPSAGMKAVFYLLFHLLTTLAKLIRPVHGELALQAATGS